MTKTIAKILMRVAGTFAGLLGLAILCLVSFLLWESFIERATLTIAFELLFLTLGAYFLYIAYLVWLKFSPVAVRHICGLLGFFTVGLVAKLAEPAMTADEPWGTLAALGGLMAILVIYLSSRRVMNCLNRWLFVDTSAGL